MHLNEVNLPDELIGRIDTLFDSNDKHKVERPSMLEPHDFDLASDLRYLLPDLPESAEYKLKVPQYRSENGARSPEFRSLLGGIASRTVLLSDDFVRETYSRSLEVKDMAVDQLSVTKRVYLGSVAIGDEIYRFAPGSAVHRLTETYWADWHGDTRLDVIVLTPTKKLFPTTNPLKPSGPTKKWSNKEKLDQVENIDRLLRTFGY